MGKTGRLAVGLLITAAAAMAATVQYTTSTPITLQPTEIGSTLTFAQFDPSLGTLQTVEFVVTGHIEGSIDLRNNGADPQTVTGTTTSNFSLSGLNATLIVNFPLSFSTGPQTIPGGSDINFTGLSADGSGNGFEGGNLAPYIGLGTYTVPVSTASGLSVLGGGGNIASSQLTSASATGDVIYTYTTDAQTPEPATMSLMGGAFLGLAALLRRRRK